MDPKGRRTAGIAGMWWLIVIFILGCVLAAIALPIYWRRERAQLVAQPQPILDAIVEAQRRHKKEHGKFWRGEHQTLSAKEAREVFGVDLTRAPDFRFTIDPPLQVGDPTLRVAAKGDGAANDIVVECVYDAFEDHSHCTGG